MPFDLTLKTEVHLTQGFTTVVDTLDAPLVSQYKWYATRIGNAIYASTRIEEEGKVSWLYMHRLILAAKEGELCDHKDMNTLNNTRENLRICNKAQNSANRGLQQNNTTGYKGIRKIGRKWRAYIKVNQKQIHLGSFSSIEDALIERTRAGICYFGDFYRVH